VSRRDPIQSIRTQFAAILADSPAAGQVLLSFLTSDHKAAVALGAGAPKSPVVAGKKGRGRPAGSKNQPKSAGQTTTAAAPADTAAKKKPGPKPKASTPSPTMSDFDGAPVGEAHSTGD
jgi:hypothetical protein